MTIRERYEAARKPIPVEWLSGTTKGRTINEASHKRVDLADIAFANAREKCVYCGGSGKVKRHFVMRVCSCAYRGIAVKAMNRYRVLRMSGPWGRCRIERTQTGGLMRGFVEVEFLAEIDLAARRVLNGPELKVYELYEAQNADWRYCSARVGLNRGNFFHLVYVVEQKLGKALYLSGIFPAGRYVGEEVEVSQIAKPKKTNYSSPMFRLNPKWNRHILPKMGEMVA